MKKDMTEKEMKELIAEVDGTMAMEGMPLTDEIKNNMLKYLKGEVSSKELISNAINKYKKA